LNRFSKLACGTALVLCPCTLLAQRGGHGAGAGRPATAAANPTPNNSDIADFNRTVALQATPEQTARFQQLTKSTEAARKQAQILSSHAESAGSADSSRYAGLSDAVEDARNNNLQFVGSFSSSQQSGLKIITKRLGKADTDVSKQSKTLTQELERSKMDSKRIASVVEKLDKALTGFQAEQLEIGKAMGIPPEEHSQ
jgi:hypothetical protein